MNATMSGINLIVDKVFIKKFRFAPHVYEGTQNLMGFRLWTRVSVSLRFRGVNEIRFLVKIPWLKIV